MSRADQNISGLKQRAIELYKSRAKNGYSALVHEDQSKEELQIRILELELQVAELEKAAQSDATMVQRITNLLPSGVVYYQHDRNGIFTNISPGIEECLGYRPEEFMVHFSQYLTDDPINQDVFRNTEASLAGQKPDPYLVSIYHKDGSRQILEVCETSVYNHAGEIIGVEGLFILLTDYKRLQAELQESEERFYAVFMNNKAMKIILNPENGVIEDASPSAIEFYGYRPEEFIGKNINEINQLSEAEIQEEIQNTINRKKGFFEFKHQLANGEIKDVKVYSTPIKYKNEYKLYSIVFDTSP